MGDRRLTIRPAREEPVDSASVFDLAVLGHFIGFVLKSAARHKLLFATCFVMVAAGAAALARIVPSRYQVTGTVLVQPSSVIGTLANPSLNRDWDAPTRAAREVVLRRDNLIALCKKTDFLRRHAASRAPLVLARDWLYEKLRSAPLDDEARLRGVLDGIERKLWVNVGNEGTMSITFVWSDPSLTYDFVNAALESFLEARRAAEVTQVGETIAILQAHDAQVQRKVAELAASLDEKEKSAAKVRTIPRRVALPVPVVERSDETRQLEVRLDAKRRALSDLEEFRRRRLDDLQAKLTELLHVYAPEHPQVIELQKSIESLAGPSPQLDQLRAEVGAMELTLKRLAPLRPPTPPATPGAYELPNLPADDPHLDYEHAQLLAFQRQHQSLVDRIDAVRMEIDTAEVAFKYRYSIVSPPQMPRGPLHSYPLIVTVAGFFGGIAFAFFATSVRDILRARVIDRWQIERELGLTIIAEVDR
jgi:uncharacterized protein involved in exopolysaccharide biosynthesis